MKEPILPRFLGLLVAGFVLVLWWLAHQENLRLRSELDLALAESGKFRVSETKPAETAPDPEEHAELLRLRSEVGALRRTIRALSGQKGSQVEPETGVRKPGEEFVQVTHGMAVSATGEDLGPVPDRFLKGIHLGRYFRKDMLRNSGADSVTNTVETALWASVHGDLSAFGDLWTLPDPSATQDEIDHARRRDMDGLAVNLERFDSLEMVHMTFDEERNVWFVLVALDPGPQGTRIGTHFGFSLRPDGNRWRIDGLGSGDAIPSRNP